MSDPADKPPPPPPVRLPPPAPGLTVGGIVLAVLSSIVLGIGALAFLVAGCVGIMGQDASLLLIPLPIVALGALLLMLALRMRKRQDGDPKP
ncbi:MAG: hypothetical protein JOY81_03165 [Alphaproteobacteria bacterium]|nr:hypothetical protein [Alphaproteobacteria bacterium]